MAAFDFNTDALPFRQATPTATSSLDDLLYGASAATPVTAVPDVAPVTRSVDAAAQSQAQTPGVNYGRMLQESAPDMIANAVFDQTGGWGGLLSAEAGSGLESLAFEHVPFDNISAAGIQGAGTGAGAATQAAGTIATDGLGIGGTVSAGGTAASGAASAASMGPVGAMLAAYMASVALYQHANPESYSGGVITGGGYTPTTAAGESDDLNIRSGEQAGASQWLHNTGWVTPENETTGERIAFSDVERRAATIDAESGMPMLGVDGRELPEWYDQSESGMPEVGDDRPIAPTDAHIVDGPFGEIMGTGTVAAQVAEAVASLDNAIAAYLSPQEITRVAEGLYGSNMRSDTWHADQDDKAQESIAALLGARVDRISEILGADVRERFAQQSSTTTAATTETQTDATTTTSTNLDALLYGDAPDNLAAFRG